MGVFQMFVLVIEGRKRIKFFTFLWLQKLCGFWYFHLVSNSLLFVQPPKLYRHMISELSDTQIITFNRDWQFVFLPSLCDFISCYREPLPCFKLLYILALSKKKKELMHVTARALESYIPPGQTHSHAFC